MTIRHIRTAVFCGAVKGRRDMVRHHLEDDIGKRWDKNSKRRPADRISRWKEGRYGDDRHLW